MKTKLLQTQDYLLLIDEEAEIKKGNYYFANHGVMFCSKVEDGSKYPYLNQYGNYDSIHWKGVIVAYYPLTKEAKELDLPLLPNPFEEVDIEGLAEKESEKYHYAFGQQSEFYQLGFIEGYKATQAKGQFNLEDMKKAFEYGKSLEPFDSFEDFIQSLSTQKLPKEFIPMYEDDITNGWSDVLRGGNGKPKLKTIKNSKGKQELVGKYVY